MLLVCFTKAFCSKENFNTQYSMLGTTVALEGIALELVEKNTNTFSSLFDSLPTLIEGVFPRLAVIASNLSIPVDI